MARNNSGPGATVEGDMATFDTLPEHIRQKLARASYNWSPEECHDMLLQEGAAHLSEFLAAAEQTLAENHYEILASGTPYPK
jgi:hypothetical protein